MADRDVVSAPVVERDYVLTHVIEALARTDPRPQGIVFKGGTALRLCQFEDFRYSADLDFSLVEISADEALAVFRDALAECQAEHDFPMLAIDEVSHASIDYVGPLGRKRSVKLELATDELVLDVTEAQMLARYPDQSDPPARVRMYSLEEVTAEKLRCIIQRLLCRDLFDLHRLLVVQGVDLGSAWNSFEEKARHKGVDPALFKSALDRREAPYRDRWTEEIENLVLGAEVPHFEQTMRELRRALRGRASQG